MNASVVGSYPPDGLALIKVSDGSLRAASSFADSSKVKVGQVTLAIGNPLGLDSSVTSGIVSFNGRTVDEGNGVVLPLTIRTSAPIDPGNSGGALVDITGAVIGIPTLGATVQQLGGGAAPGIGFAIPSNPVKLIGDQLVQAGKVTNSGRAALGIVGSDVGDASGGSMGVLVRSVDPNSAAAKAGIKAGVVISSVNSQQTPDLSTLGQVLAQLHPGDTVPVGLLQSDGSKQNVQVTLGELSA